MECIKDLGRERTKGEENKWGKARRVLYGRIGMEKEETKRKQEEVTRQSGDRKEIGDNERERED